MRRTGKYVLSTVSGEVVRSFVPSPLPPRPHLSLPAALQERLKEGTQELAKLNLASRMVPSAEWFLYSFVRKEAVLTSQIEGTQATLVDLLAYEAGAPSAVPTTDVQEVCNYLDAIAFARAELANPRGLPLSIRLLKEAHRRLLKGMRGENKQPGELRRSQNWIGGTRPGNATFVPPPPTRMIECLNALEEYMHAKNRLPALIRVGLIHVQFETIHPFLDGNGRIGRLLIALLLEHWKLLESPLLYISLYFKQHRTEYYERLNAVRFNGDWEGWSRFFLDGVTAVAREATDLAGQVFALFETDRNRLLKSRSASVPAIKLLHCLPGHPIVNVARAVKLLGTTKPTASKAVLRLAELGILKETTGRRRDRTFAYKRYLDLLKKGTELER